MTSKTDRNLNRQDAFENKNGILIFDKDLNRDLSSYDPHYLEELEKVEPGHFWFETRRDLICKTFLQNVDRKSRILEIGAGTGFIAEKLQKHGYTIEVSDCYLNGLIAAQKRGITRLYQFDLFNPPFKEEFDVICFFDVLEHLKEDRHALMKIQQMLKPNGMVILTVPAHMFLWSQEDRFAGHWRRYGKKDLENLFRSCDLRPLSVRYFFLMILPLLFLRKWLPHPKEKFQFKIHFFLNRILTYLTKFEATLGRLIPNFAGGSLIAIAKKKGHERKS